MKLTQPLPGRYLAKVHPSTEEYAHLHLLRAGVPTATSADGWSPCMMHVYGASLTRVGYSYRTCIGATGARSRRGPDVREGKVPRCGWGYTHVIAPASRGYALSYISGRSGRPHLWLTIPPPSPRLRCNDGPRPGKARRCLLEEVIWGRGGCHPRWSHDTKEANEGPTYCDDQVRSFVVIAHTI